MKIRKNGFSHESNYKKLTAAVGELLGELVGDLVGALVSATVRFGVGDLVG